jgi:mRNA interferase MazF
MKRGEVVLVDFPFSDGSGTKYRPALVVQADALNKTLKDTILATMTTSSRASPASVEISLAENPRCGLHIPCAVRCENLHTVEQRLILGSSGYLSQQTMQKVDACLRATLKL